MNTFPSVIESIVSVEGVEGGTVGSGVGVSEDEGVVSAGTSATPPSGGSWPWWTKIEATIIDGTSIDKTIINSRFLRMVGIL